jgi:hypothetical protein
MGNENSLLTPAGGGDQNPFVYGRPVRVSDFFNRDQIIARLLEETITGKMQKDVWITGERQVGKTSLLKYLQTKYESYDKKIKLYSTGEYLDVAFLYLNTQDTITRDDFYRDLRQCLKNFSDFKIETLEDPFNNFVYALKYLYSQQKYYVVFLVDEFDSCVEKIAVKNPEAAASFLAELNKLLEGGYFKASTKIFGSIMAANHTIEELLKKNSIRLNGSGLVVESIELPWFTKEQVEELAHRYLENLPLRFSESEIDFCYKMTQGYPYFVQKLYYMIYKEKLKDPNSKSYLKKVKEEFGQDFKETIKGWGGTNIPKRTLEKLRHLAGHMIKAVGDRSLSLIFKGIEEYMKMQIKP